MEDAEEGQPQVSLADLDMDQILGVFIGLLSSKVWQYMGLRLIPGKEELEKDLVKAAAAIDIVAYLTEKLAPSLPSTEAERLRSMVADLQINYAKQV